MVLFPEVQAKAQAELDAVVGSERLPCSNDRDSLPYINAVWKEALRWHSILPLGIVSVPVDVSDSAHHAGKSGAPCRERRHLLRRVRHPKRIVHHWKRVVSIVLASLHP